MIDAAEAALTFVAGRSRRELDSNRMLLFAVVRAVEVLGEAASKTSSDLRTAASSVPWASIVGMRNRLVHGYFDIDTGIVWQTVTEELPRLLRALQSLIPAGSEPREAVAFSGRPTTPASARFERYVGIDYSGAETPTSSLAGLRVYTATRQDAPVEQLPPKGTKKYWTRRGIAEWLEALLSEPVPVIVGIDHGFSFPRQYFDRYQIPMKWDVFLEDFCLHWPTHQDDTYVDFIRDGAGGAGPDRQGQTTWRRITEKRTGSARIGRPNETAASITMAFA